MGFVYLKENYYGSSGYHANDIAIIVLPIKVNISNVVAPVCLDWTKKYTNVANGAMGKVNFFSIIITRLNCGAL